MGGQGVVAIGVQHGWGTPFRSPRAGVLARDAAGAGVRPFGERPDVLCRRRSSSARRRRRHLVEERTGDRKLLRHRTGLSHSVVAERIGHSRHALGGWERGAEPPLVALRRLAAVYGVPTEVVARAARVQPPPLLDSSRWKPGTIHDVLVVIRRWHGLTQRDVANLTGCSFAAVRTWEAGLRSPSPAALERLERAYGLEPGALLAAYPRR